MNFRILGAILKKDVLSLAPIVALTALLFLADPIIVRLDLLPVWTMYNVPVILVALVVLILSVFQLDSAASLTDDWLCRPVPASASWSARSSLLVLSAVYLPRAIGTFVADLSLGFPLAEAFLDAVLLQDKLSLFLLPILLFTAIITRTFVQGFGVLFAIFVCVFVLPTPFVRPPGPLDPGIRDELLFSGMEWLALDARQAGVARARRCRFLAGVLAPATGAGARADGAHRLRHVVLHVAADGIDALELHVRAPAGLGPGAGRGHGAHFPAQSAHLLSRRAPRRARDRRGVRRRARSGTASRCGMTRSCADVGPNSVAFLTSIEPRGLPLDWRVKLNYVQADYSAGGETLYSLRPARYITDQRRRWIAGACLDAAGKRGAKAAGRCSPSWSSRIR